jgi:uracil-DNA glycosylase
MNSGGALSMSNNPRELHDKILALIGPSASDWRPALEKALCSVEQSYLIALMADRECLPQPIDRLLAAFGTVPLGGTRYILMGESPYPRQESALGIAFLDGAISEIWNSSGALHKSVNRATSLRNLIKAILVAEGALNPDRTDKGALEGVYDCEHHVRTLDEMFDNLYRQGILAANFTPVLRSVHMNGARRPGPSVPKWKHRSIEAQYWIPFWHSVFVTLVKRRNPPAIIACGRPAGMVASLAHDMGLKVIKTEHPYNLSFITNPDILKFLCPLQLLKRRR